MWTHASDAGERGCPAHERSLIHGVSLMHRATAARIVSLAGLTIACSISTASPTLVALTGDTTLRSDGTSAIIGYISDPSIGPRGDIYFNANPPGVFEEGDAVFVPAREAGLRLFRSVVSTGDEAPGTPGIGLVPNALVMITDSGNSQFSLGSRTAINTAGGFSAWHLLEENPVAPGFVNAFGIYRSEPGGLRNVAITRLADNDTLIVLPGDPTLTDDGRTAWIQRLGNIGDVLNVESDGVVTVSLGIGEPAPGTDTVFGGIRDYEISRNGNFAFGTSLLDPGTLLRDPNGWSVWAGTLDGVELVARTGEVPPVPGAQRYVSFFGAVRTNDAGDVLFWSTVSDGSELFSAIIRERDGVLEALASEGSPAPGVQGGAYAVLDRRFRLRLGGPGHALFGATLEGAGIDATNDTGIWRVEGDDITILAREADPAPGVPDAVFDDLLVGVTGTAQIEAVSNDTSHHTFLGRLRPGIGGVVEGQNDIGLWSFDPVDEALHLIARTGDAVDLAGDGSDVRIVAAIRFNPVYGLADNAWLAYTLEFDDGTFALMRTRLPGPFNPCDADLDADGVVDLGDFGAFGDAFGTSFGDDGYDPRADFNGDGDVDLGDFGTFGNQFGRTGCTE